MNFLQNNFIFIFGALSLISIVFAASGLAKTNIHPLSTSIEAENNAAPAAPEPGPKPEPAPTVSAKTKTHYQITGINRDDDAQRESLDD